MDRRHPDIDSFVIRFIRAGDPAAERPLRGSIRHLQSGVEHAFLDWQEAESFIRRYIPLAQLNAPGPIKK